MSFFSSIWHKFLGGKATPWADISYIDQQIHVKSYNPAFVEKLKRQMGDLTLDIGEDGRIKMKLDWNPAFIRHLADNGIIAETEDEAIQQYLSLLTNKVAEDISPDSSREDIDAAFRDLDQETQAELEEAARMVSEQANAIKKARKPRRKARTID